MLKIILHEKDGMKRSLLYRQSSVTVGRSVENDFSVNRAGISRFHARIFIEGGEIFIEDLESTDGVYVNGTRVKSARLGEDNEVVIGELVFSVVTVQRQ